MKLGHAVFLLALLFSAPLQAQASGRIIGRVVDARTGEPLADVTIVVEGTGLGALSRVDGRFLIADVPAGEVILRAQSIGYASRTLPVRIAAGVVGDALVQLDPAAVQIDAIQVTAAAERGSVARALEQQRTAAAMVSAVTAEQIARSPDGDAAAAMQRVSGVTVQDGKYIHVRGLGERYTTATLNGARIPSPEPERKVVPLDLFPTGLLQSITTSKTFTPDQSGDFSGAQVDIRTREFPGERQLTLSTSAGFNTRVTGTTLFAAPSTGSEWLGFASTERALPQSVRAAGDFTGAVGQDDFNRMVNEFRNAWTPERQRGRGSSSFGASLGGTDALFGQRVSYVLSGTYAYGEEVRANEVRARALAGSGGAPVEVDRFTGSTGRSTVLWGGLTNASTLIGQNTRLFLNGTYNRTADNEARQELGSSENHGGIPMQIQRLRFVERTVHSLQVGAEHALGRHAADWRVTQSGVRRHEPDRSEFVTAQTQEDSPYRWFAASNEGAVRSFGDLTERSLEASANYRITLGAHAIKVGALTRSTDRDAVSSSYSISALQLPADALALTPELIFDGRYSAAGQGYMRVTPLSQGGSYNASDLLLAGYAMFEVAPFEKLRITGGARVERSELDLAAQATVAAETAGVSADYTDVLPSLALNYSITDAQSLRISGSRTLARPEYRELANVMYREVIGADNLIGNPDLKRTLVRNYDVRWEWYPDAGELLSAALFVKQFQDPIERVYQATSGTSVLTFVNAESASNVGVELELRKRLGFIAEPLDALTFFSNLTLMQSEIRIPRSATSQTNANRAMVGQAPYVVNGGVTWSPEWRETSATLLYNVVGERILNAGEVPLPDVVERPRHVVDLSLRTMLSSAVSLKLDARNLLDAPYEFMQGSVVRESYRTGRLVSVGVSWRQ